MAPITEGEKALAYDDEAVTTTPPHPGVDIGVVIGIEPTHVLNESFNLWSSLGLQHSLTLTPLAC